LPNTSIDFLCNQLHLTAIRKKLYQKAGIARGDPHNVVLHIAAVQPDAPPPSVHSIDSLRARRCLLVVAAFLDYLSMAAASSPAASAASPGRGAGDPPAAAAAATARTAGCPCPICLEAFKDEAYLDTCFRKSPPPSSLSLFFSSISDIKLASA
jgi:hypothetical protein